MTRKRNIVKDNSKTNCGVGSEIIYNTEVLKSNLCYNNDAYINAPAIQVALKNCAPFS